MSDLYTFYFQYRGGTYTSQFDGTLEEAIKKWASVELPTVYEISKKNLKDVVGQIETKGEEPTAVGPAFIKNVWHMGFLSGRTYMQLLIVKTAT